ncbi:MAG: hypothetical protein TE42_08230 [Candidatus Synechococcus spongiarum SP3]|uniref:Uncharacterized protein n=1 Tax=Candidatus Synechococcus spongiarum SP3 TaxID=1604020 RepID=A0A0G2HKS9_9SYNE|nr:MAG: hypothetical protein TE42_08230 [Candidatus Synechococcus spongiarum SP3]
MKLFLVHGSDIRPTRLNLQLCLPDLSLLFWPIEGQTADKGTLGLLEGKEDVMIGKDLVAGLIRRVVTFDRNWYDIHLIKIDTIMLRETNCFQGSLGYLTS